MPIRQSSLIVVLISLIIAVIMGVSTWDINYWPSDTEVYYMEATRELPKLKFISEIHKSLDQERVRWLHGKEGYILIASLFQQWMQDTQTLRPFILLNIVSVFFSSIFIFFIARSFWGQSIAFLCYFLFSFSFWPYIYVLFAKHQPFGLFLFLLAVLLINLSLKVSRKSVLNLLSGFMMGFALFSSTVAVIYVPYYAAAVLYAIFSLKKTDKKWLTQSLKAIIMIAFGLTMSFIYFNYPDIGHNVRSFLEYVDISGRYNHFYYNQPVLQQWLADPALARGGWEWVLKYFFLVMPVLFPAFLICQVYLLACVVRRRFGVQDALVTSGLLALGWSAPLMAEIRGVAQYGANYFPSLIGILIVAGYTGFRLIQFHEFRQIRPTIKPVLLGLSLILAGCYLFLNLYTFTTDIFPTRMATTFLSAKIKALNLQTLYTYHYHPQRTNVVDCLDPGLIKKIQFKAINHIYEPMDGYILVPPITGNSIYIAAISDYSDFDRDPFLNEIVRKGMLEQYAVASYPTLAASPIWPHEEEILSYRYLILNQFSREVSEKGKVWLLDVEKLRADVADNIPSQDEIIMNTQKVKNIGTKRPVYLYKGYKFKLDKPMSLNTLVARMYKVGNPGDSLRAYVFRVEEKQDVWIPQGENYISEPVPGFDLKNQLQGSDVNFHFPSELQLSAGYHNIVIYRTGKPDDTDFYRIYSNKLAVLE